MKKSTAKKVESQNRTIIQSIGFEDFSAVCQEYQIIEKATRELLELAKKEDTPIRVKVDIYKWVVEMNIGKPKQMADVNLNPITLEDVLKEFDEDPDDRGVEVQEY